MAPAPFARASRRALGPPRINSPPLSCQPMQGQGAQMRPAASSPLALPGVGSPPLGASSGPGLAGVGAFRSGYRLATAPAGSFISNACGGKNLFFCRRPLCPPLARCAGLPPLGGFYPCGGRKAWLRPLIRAHAAPCLWLWCFRVLPVGFSGPRGLSLPGSRPALPRGCGQ